MSAILKGLSAVQAQTNFKLILSPILAISLSVITGIFIFSCFGISVRSGLYFFYVEPLKDFYGVSELLLKVSPLLICSYGLLFCFKGGVWNIGAEGQYLSGAMAAGWMALWLTDVEVWYALPAVLLAGLVGGFLCAALAALLKVFVGVNELLTTIMLNYIAVNLLMFLVNGPLKDPNGFSFPESAIFSDHVMLPVFSDAFRLNVSIFFPLLLMALVFFVFRSTRFGFEVNLLGKSLSAAKNAGVPVKKYVFLVLVLCGAFAGLAGASEVAGPVGQLIPQLSLGYGYTAIICVYLGRMNPFGLALASFLLALTVVGAESVQLQYELPSAIAAVFQGLILFFLLAADFTIERFQKRGLA